MATHASRRERRRARIRRRYERQASKLNSKSPFGARTNLKYKPAKPVKESAQQQSTREHGMAGPGGKRGSGGNTKRSSKDLSQGKSDSKPKYYTGEGVKSGKSFHAGVSDKSKPKDLKSHIANLTNKLNDDPENAKIKSELAGARIRLAKDILGKKSETKLRKADKTARTDDDATTKGNTRRAKLKAALGDDFSKYYHTKSKDSGDSGPKQIGKTVKPPAYKGKPPTSNYPGGKIGPPARRQPKPAPKMAPRPGAAPGPGYKPPKRKKYGSGLTGVR